MSQLSQTGIRAFFAVPLPQAIRVEVAALRDELEESLTADARWVSDENLHLTLKFLGDISQDSVQKLLGRALSRLARHQPFQAELTGIGAFPHTRMARILWLGVGQGAPSFAKLARKLDAAGKGVGAQRDRQPFRAHLSLARFRTPTPLERLPQAPSPLTFPVEEVVLYESRLSSSGSTYVPLAQLPLGAKAESVFEFAPEL